PVRSLQNSARKKSKVLLAQRLNNGKKTNIVKDHIEGISTQDVVFTFVSLVRCQRKIQFFIVSLRLTTFLRAAFLTGFSGGFFCRVIRR
ncbi:MAG: hypothetical protein Q4A04_08130, partial [Eubacteriales bacterium]|nr:hypothetical protein [Eubacteriales bacterium]